MKRICDPKEFTTCQALEFKVEVHDHSTGSTEPLVTGLVTGVAPDGSPIIAGTRWPWDKHQFYYPPSNEAPFVSA